MEHPLKVALSALNLQHVWLAMFTNNAKKDDKIKSKLGNVDKEYKNGKWRFSYKNIILKLNYV